MYYRVVSLDSHNSYNATRAELKHMFNSVNGVLFPGGGADLDNTTLYLAGKYIYDLALEVSHSIHYTHTYPCVAFLGE